MKPEYQRLLDKMKVLSQNKVRHSYVGPWGMEHDYSPMDLDEFLCEVEKMMKAESVEKPHFTPHDEYADVMPVLEFKDLVECGAFIPSDGSGYWAIETHKSDLSVWGSKRPTWATHVAWYNK